uniref:Uncharacterized protein n=1 Tax=Knipowitschia caucasica TaxID=637954 RepID=A0AAV2KVB2_KNICA
MFGLKTPHFYLSGINTFVKPCGTAAVVIWVDNNQRSKNPKPCSNPVEQSRGFVEPVLWAIMSKAVISGGRPGTDAWFPSHR